MKKLIFRKIILDVLAFFLVSSFALTLIVWVIQAVNYLDFVSEDGHSFRVYFMFSVLTIPKIFSKISIFIFFISLFVIISKYEENNEILILWTNGLKKTSFINSILLFSLVVFLFQIILTNFIVPKTQDLARSYIRSSNIDYFPSLIKPKKFIDTVEKLTLFVDEKNKDKMENIFLKDNIDSKSSQIVSAKNGYIVTNDNKSYFILENGEIVNIDQGGTNIVKFERTIYNLSKYNTKTTTYPKIQEKNTNLLIRCIDSLINKNIEFRTTTFSCEKNSINAFMQEAYKRIFAPSYILIVSLIASYLVFISKSDSHYNKKKILLFLIGVFFLTLSEISIRYVNYNFIKNVYIFFIPLGFTFLTYFYLLTKAKNKRI